MSNHSIISMPYSSTTMGVIISAPRPCHDNTIFTPLPLRSPIHMPQIPPRLHQIPHPALQDFRLREPTITMAVPNRSPHRPGSSNLRVLRIRIRVHPVLLLFLILVLRVDNRLGRLLRDDHDAENAAFRAFRRHERDFCERSFKGREQFLGEIGGAQEPFALCAVCYYYAGQVWWDMWVICVR